MDIALLGFLILLNGLLAMSEVALLTARQPRLVALATQGDAMAASAARLAADYFVSCNRMRRYSSWPRSPSRPMGPVAGISKAASTTSPLTVQWAVLPFTVTTISFQSSGRYCCRFL